MQAKKHWWNRKSPFERLCARDPLFAAQHELLNRLSEMPPEEAGRIAMAMGPVRGSFGDYNSYGPGRCGHLYRYPGCPGGCNH